jgi:hypothetical protein
MSSAPTSARRIAKAGSVLIVLGAVVLLGSGAAKLAHVPPVVAQMASNGLDGPRLAFVGLLEVFSALLFLFPSTRAFGLLLVSSFLGGAIATHLQHGQSIVPPSIVLLVIWLGTWLRHPEILWSWPRTRRATQVPARTAHIAEGL